MDGIEMKSPSRWKLYFSGFLAAVGVLIVIGILFIVGFFYFEAREIDQMAARFRTELEGDPDAFKFVERNRDFFFFKLNEASPPFKECLNVSPIFHKKGKYSVQTPEGFESSSLDRALDKLKKIRSHQNCPEFTALYFKGPTGGFRRVSVRMKVDSNGILTAIPEFHIYD